MMWGFFPLEVAENLVKVNRKTAGAVNRGQYWEKKVVKTLKTTGDVEIYLPAKQQPLQLKIVQSV